MPVKLDPAAIVAVCMVLSILACSAVLWIMHLQQAGRVVIAEENVKAWPIGWVNFGIFLCAMIVSVVFVQGVAGQVIHLFSDPPPIATEAGETGGVDHDETVSKSPQLTPWMTVLAVLLLQFPLLATFYGLRRFYPEQFAGELNSVTLTPKQAFIQAIPAFVRYLPVIWIVSFIWSSFLKVLQEQGIIDEFPIQQLVTLFANGGDPVAITLLVICAVILAPIVEEIIFRGGIYRFLKSQTNILPAQIISGSFFAVMHGNLMSFLPLVVVGIVLARVYERSGNILTSMCFHACFNGFSLLMLLIMSQSSIPME